MLQGFETTHLSSTWNIKSNSLLGKIGTASCWSLGINLFQSNFNSFKKLHLFFLLHCTTCGNDWNEIKNVHYNCNKTLKGVWCQVLTRKVNILVKSLRISRRTSLLCRSYIKDQRKLSDVSSLPVAFSLTSTGSYRTWYFIVISW